MSQIKTTATVLAIGLAGVLFMFQNCAEPPVSATRSKKTSTSTCATIGDCYEEEEDQTSTTTQPVTTTTQPSNGSSTARAEITSITVLQGGTQIPLAGYYNQSNRIRAVVSGRNMTGVQWGSSGLTFSCTQTGGGNSTCTSAEIILGVENAGFYGSLSVVAMNGANNSLRHSVDVASQCYVLLNECKFILLGTSLSQPPNPNEVMLRGRSMGAFIASSLTTSATCNLAQSQDGARGLAAVSSFNRSNGNACVFFRTAFASGNSADYQCLYIGLNSANDSVAYYNATYEVPCNSGLTLAQMNGVTSDMTPYQAYVGLIIRHRASGLADMATMYANCASGTCQISNIKQGNRTGLCAAGTGMCSF